MSASFKIETFEPRHVFDSGYEINPEKEMLAAVPGFIEPARSDSEFAEAPLSKRPRTSLPSQELRDDAEYDAYDHILGVSFGQGTFDRIIIKEEHPSEDQDFSRVIVKGEPMIKQEHEFSFCSENDSHMYDMNAPGRYSSAGSYSIGHEYREDALLMDIEHPVSAAYLSSAASASSIKSENTNATKDMLYYQPESSERTDSWNSADEDADCDADHLSDIYSAADSSTSDVGNGLIYAWPSAISVIPVRIGYLQRILNLLKLSYIQAPNSYVISSRVDAHVLSKRPTAEQLISLTHMINERRNFANVSSYSWIPKHFDQNTSKKDLDPSMYIAILRPGDGLHQLEIPSSNPFAANDEFEFECNIFESVKKGVPNKADRSRAKRLMLKRWDPLEVYYPLGYVDHKDWIHMDDLPPEQQYHFDLVEFQSKPDYPHVRNERVHDSDIELLQNQYDSFYVRHHPVTKIKECYCGCCKSWHKRDQCNWLHHMKSAHGIRSRTKQRYALPLILSHRTDRMLNTGLLIGFCDKCQSWQNVNNSTSKSNYASWFLHQASHDVERNRAEGCSGKKLSNNEIKKQQLVVKRLEAAERAKTLAEVERLLLDEFNTGKTTLTGPFFQRAENFVLEEYI